MKNYKFSDEPNILKRVIVRLMMPAERARFDELLETKHYLSSARLGGQSLRYIAELDGEWVALACFSGAAPHLKAREKWLGWSARQRARRLGFVVNNSRYLVLAERQQLPNLASRVLGMCLRRLSRDWQQAWGHPVLLVESFVDETRYRGTCYRACGFEAVGMTAGFARASRDYYHEHGEPKQLYLKALHKEARILLRRARLPKDLAEHEQDVAGPCPLRAPSLRSLFSRFRTLEDKRIGHGLRHRQSFVLACAAIATLMGAGGYKAIEDVCKRLTKRQLKALGCQPDRDGRYAAPSDSTLFRILGKIDAKQFDRIIGQWLVEQEVSELAQLAVDGKVLRGSSRTDGKALQLLSIVTHRLRLTMAQEPIESKSNEIPAFPKLLRSLPNHGHALVTADAMHCQQESARVTTQECGWDYLFGLKGNQGAPGALGSSLLNKDCS